MNNKATLSVLTLAMVFANSPSWAVTNTRNESLPYAKSLQKVLQREQQLEKEVVSLRAEVKQLQKARFQESRSRSPAMMQPNPLAKTKPAIYKGAPKKKNLYQEHALTFLGGVPILSSPYFGIRSGFDAARLIVNLPSMNEDLRLLQQRQAIEHTWKAKGFKPFTQPFVEISGKLEGAATWSDPYTGTARGDFDVTSAEVDVSVGVNRWTTAFMALNFDNAPPGMGVQRTANSRVFFNKAFVTVGNLNETPIYGTFGQFYVPFGRYASNMLSSPLPMLIGQVKTRAVLLGYQQRPGVDGINASVYAFRGDSAPDGRGNGGANLNYSFDDHDKDMSGDIGVGWIANMADADGQQATGGAGFTGFGAFAATEFTMRRVPAVSVHGSFAYGPYSVLAEFVTATRAFSPMALTFNGAGAEPDALNIEAAYRFRVLNHPSAFALGYGHSDEALGFALPRNRYLAAVSTSIWRDTIQTLEFRHDKNYGVGTTATGLAGPGGVLAAVPTTALGKDANLLTAQFGVYF